MKPSRTSYPLLLKLSKINFTETGPLSNISLFIQESEHFGGDMESTLSPYPQYPMDYGFSHPNPISEVGSLSYIYS